MDSSTIEEAERGLETFAERWVAKFPGIIPTGTEHCDDFCAPDAAIRDMAGLIVPPIIDELGLYQSVFPVIAMRGGMVDKHKLKRVYEQADSR